MLLQSESLEMEYFQKKLDITKPTELRFVENSSGEQVLLNWVECGADYIKNCKNAAFSIKRETKNKKYEKIEGRKSSLQSILEFDDFKSSSRINSIEKFESTECAEQELRLIEIV
ncbi:hypothetical protein HN011_001288 [Eciton burchellii]|nr:hypothetical protein HN011_001288 [Eciton burchellii]